MNVGFLVIHPVLLPLGVEVSSYVIKVASVSVVYYQAVILPESRNLVEIINMF